jgi:hypothetical protein
MAVIKILANAHRIDRGLQKWATLLSGTFRGAIPFTLFLVRFVSLLRHGPTVSKYHRRDDTLILARSQSIGCWRG